MLSSSPKPDLRAAGAAVSLVILITLPFLMSACSDWALPRGDAAALSDSATETPSPPKAGASRRAARTAKPAVGVSEAEGFAQVRGTLRRLVAAEETFYAENGTYSEDLSLIGFAPAPNTAVRFLWIGRDGWAASGTHADMPGRDCVVFVGKSEEAPTTLKYVRQGREGVPVCDETHASNQAGAPSPSAGAKPPQPPVDTGSALSALDPRTLMKVDLRNLVQSQETYLANQGIYARRTEPLALQYLWREGVDISILTADRQSWSAKATHVRFPRKSCVIWFGPVKQRPVTDAQRRQGSRSGVPVCDD
ncbi:MAG TPA: hypothetical protein VFU40_06220 [Gemmatimonadales bacterium]|nr:hypothetical protein [Gemmatimonadales bacterium]